MHNLMIVEKLKNIVTFDYIKNAKDNKIISKAKIKNTMLKNMVNILSFARITKAIRFLFYLCEVFLPTTS